MLRVLTGFCDAGRKCGFVGFRVFGLNGFEWLDGFYPSLALLRAEQSRLRTLSGELVPRDHSRMKGGGGRSAGQTG